MKSVRQYFVEEIALTIDRRPEEIDMDVPFSRMGIKSMDLVAITARLANEIRRDLPSTLGFDYPSISAVVSFLEKESDESCGDDSKGYSTPVQPSWYKSDESPEDGDESVAVVGIGLKFPGGSNTPAAFWNFLAGSGDAITRVPGNRWRFDDFLDTDPAAPGKMTTPWGGFLDDIDQFDPEFFGISPREAQGIDPQQRLLLEVGWKALEDAGIDPSKLRGGNTGVFVGISGSDYGRLLFKDVERLDLYSGTGSSTAIAANRLSYFLGLRGPSLAVDTACSSSLVTVDLACKSLKNRTCDLALAGGVNLILSPEMTIIFSKAGLMANDGRCKTFDASADGYVRSEGCGIVALKRLSSAIKDKNRIYGVIRGSYINQDGESNGLTVPNGVAQEMLIRSSLKQAGVAPHEVGYAETHGTGTSIGDPIEVRALGRVLGKGRKSPLVIGSVKTNIGHLEQAAGIASLIKVLLSLENEMIPAHLHFNELNPLISLDEIPAKIPVEPVPWPANVQKRIATVSGFSFGGVNAHLVVEEPPAIKAPAEGSRPGFHLLTLCARDKSTLDELTDEYLTFLEQHPEIDPADFCYTANAGRRDFPWRAAVAGKDTQELVKGLQRLKNNDLSLDAWKTVQGVSPRNPAFLFTGQGSQYPGMGRELYALQPVFREQMDKCNAILTQYHSISLNHLIYEQNDSQLINQTVNTQPALFSIEYAMAQMYRSWGIEPAFVMGHSVGEFVAACVAGVFSLADGLKLISARGRLIQALPREGKMVVCLCALDLVEELKAPYGNDLSIAAVNGPSNTVVSGKSIAVDGICKLLEQNGISWVPLQTSHAFHSVLMEPMIQAFKEVAETVRYESPKIPYISNVTGEIIENDEVCSPDYWCRHILSAVMFEAGVRTLYNKGCNLFLEVGPNPVLSGMASAILPKDTAVFAPSLRRGMSDEKMLLSGMGPLYTNGVNIDWCKQAASFTPSIVSIPHYPFRRRRCWFEEDGPSKGFHPSGGTRINTALGGILYEYTCQGSSFYMTDHRVYGHGVMSGSTLVAMAFSKLPEVLGILDFFLDSYFVLEPLYIPEEAAFTLQLIFKWLDDQRLSFEIFSNDPKAGHENWTRHAQGEAGVNPAGSQPENSFASEEIKKRCTIAIDSDRLYEDLWNGGLELGHHFKWIERIWRRDGEAFVLMRLPADAKESYDDELPPGLIDSCIQTIFACLDFDKNSAYMFLGIDQLRFYGPASGRLYCHMVLQTGVEDQDLMVGNYQFWTETGQLIVEAKGVHVKRVQQDALSFLTAKKKDRKSLYDIHWKIKDRTNISAQHAGSWLIFAENRADGDALSSALKTRHMTHSVICLDSDAHPWPDFDTLEMQMASFEFSNIIYCGKGKNWETKESFSDCAAVLSLVQWLSQRNVTAKLWLLTRGAQQPDMDYSDIDPLSAMLWGFGKVIALEHPELFGGVIDLPYELQDPVVDRLMAELTRPQDENMMSIRGKECYVPRLQHLEPDGREAEVKEIRGDASYMITGGTGGLGLGLARWLGQKGAGHIVLTGRRPLSKKAEKDINDLEKEGIRIQFIRGDVSNGVSLAAVFKEIAGTLPPLKGVFHLAGVVDDGLITRLDWDRFSTVITPKVSGTRNLHHLTRNLDLDYFVMFSSVVSLLGSPGQSSYAAANAFMDALALWRRNAGFPALVINWGPWKGPGMTGRLGQADQNRWERSGFELLDPETSFSQLGTLLSGSAVRAAVIDADWNTYIRNNLGSSVVPMLSELVKGTAAVKAPVPSPGSAGSLDALKNSEPDMRGTLARELIAKLVAEVMWMEDTSHIDPNVSLMESGLDSLMAMELRSRFRKDWGVDLTLADFLKTPTMEALVQTLLSGIENPGAGDVKTAGYPQVVPDPGHRYDPFPLTDVQQAYWMGRSGGLVLGNVSCHVYPEVSVKKLDIKRLEKAVKRLMERHDTLRLVVSPEGQQRILEAVPDYHIPVQDMRGWAPDRAEQAISAVRKQMESQILDSENGLLFEIRASQLDDHTRLHISFDLLIGDGWSFGILIRDLYQYYLEPQADIPPLELTFRDYVLAQEKMKETDSYRESLEYWQQRLLNLPGPPDLPLGAAPEALGTPKFIRKTGRLNEDQWNNLKKLGARAGLTPSGILLAAFCDVLAVWSKSPDFTINLTMFNRFPLHEQVNRIVGDFTTLTLLEVHIDAAQSFETRAGNIQQQLWRDLEYQQITGVEVLRQMARQRGHGSELNFPVVFTSVLPYSGAGNEGTSISVPGAGELGLNLEYCISQTPQVWLDHQIFEQNGRLIFNWDLVENLFPPGMIEDMFDAYCGLIERLAQDPAEWKQTGLNLTPESHVQMREVVNDTDADVSKELLHTLFFKQAVQKPEREALITSEKRMTYNELLLQAVQIGRLLQNEGVKPNDLVAVIMEKGWEQVVAVLGILNAGAAYLPIDPELPAERIEHLLKDGQVAFILTQSRLENQIGPEARICFCVDKMETAGEVVVNLTPIQTPDDLAYIIYTSGSTGLPKGVMIDHRGAVNTIIDINRRFDLNSTDRVLALSNLNFDLSVYDIFGTLAAGGTIIMPDANRRKDPAHWTELMSENGVTVWNSVPALMQMLVEYALGRDEAIVRALRLVMLSGDWIPLDLPDRIRALAKEADIIGLGGATEASIWSCIYPIQGIDPTWKSFPYGLPMANQRFYVLNEYLEACPDWVPGQLYIGGCGLARGYWGDEKKTNNSFITHPRTGERLYHTGDLGRYKPDGHIEFLGREDFQVKVNGYRIELGEIESALKAHPEVQNAVVLVGGAPPNDSHLVGYIVPEKGRESSLFKMHGTDETVVQNRWDQLTRARCLQQAGESSAETDISTFLAFWQQMEELYEKSICLVLKTLGVYTSPREKYTLDDLLHQCGIHSRYRKWLFRALTALTDKKLLRRTDQVFENDRPLPDESLDALVNNIHAGAKNILGFTESEVALMFTSPARNLADILRETIHSAEIYTSEQVPEIYQKLFRECNAIVREVIGGLSLSLTNDENLRILEIGAGVGSTTSHVLPALPLEKTVYYYTDISNYFLEMAGKNFDDFPFVRYGLLDIEEDPQAQEYQSHSFDMVIASSMLHDVRDLKQALENIKSVLAPGGVLLLVEETCFHRPFDLNMGLHQGWDRFEDEALRKDHPLLSKEQWREFLLSEGFENYAFFSQPGSVSEFLGFEVMLFQGPSSVHSFQSADLQAFLGKKLPKYMVPSRYMQLDALPLTSNGKLDRKALPEVSQGISESINSFVKPRTQIEADLAEIWARVLHIDRVSTHDDFFALGGDSLLSTRLIVQLRETFSIELPMRKLFESSNIAEMADFIQNNLGKGSKTETPSSPLPPVIPDLTQRHQPFPLTDIQHAYWFGRIGAYELGNVATHVYFEFDNDNMNIERLNLAWRSLVERHEMLRAVVLPDARQQIIEQVPPYSFRVIDLRGKDKAFVAAELAAIRREMSHQVLPSDQWPLFDIRVVRLDNDRIRLHLDFDALIADAYSLFLLMKEWLRLYKAPNLVLPPLELSFRDYVMAERTIENSVLYKNDQAYWLRRIPDLAPPPDLPLSKNPGEVAKPRFARRSANLDPQKWSRLKNRLSGEGLTPSGLLIAVYAKVLSAWSKSSRFTLNVTLFNRHQLDPHVNEIVGDFTSLSLLEVNGGAMKTFSAAARSLQEQLWRDLDHRLFSGVHVIREMARQRGGWQRAVMPVVFTGAVSLGSFEHDASVLSQMGELNYSITQTPQVWLDHQAYEQNGSLVYNWDAVEELFPEGLLDDMFGAYSRYLEHLADSEEHDDRAWSGAFPLIPQSQMKKQAGINATKAVVSTETLHSLFLSRATENPEKTAVISSSMSLSYETLSRYSRNIGWRLREEGVLPNTLVAVVMEKGWEQIAAVLGILYSGAAFLPIDPSVPMERLRHLLNDGQVKFILTQSLLEDKIEWPEDITIFPVDKIENWGDDAPDDLPFVQTCDDLAYVIHTSGSTGLPKGVMIDHRGVVNTILDINKRFNIGSEDRVLGISALNFDLSVFDIFGTLAAGGTIVLPDPSAAKDPGNWLTLIKQEGVTIWNSVPALMQMLVEYVTGIGDRIPDSVRLALLSGDWIPVDLPEKIRTIARHPEIISLGGATEASIWSILYPVNKVDSQWNSIPYGLPMANQQVYVLNENMKNCPEWVTGQLYIGGIGLAKGYWGDKQKTCANFIRHPESGIALYRTGDLGRFLPNGHIEFLGREDQQVKINGYRIELGEIEFALKQVDTVNDAVVVAVTDPEGNKYLTGHVILNKTNRNSEQKLKNILKKKLPKYMVPSYYFFCESFPVSANGKIDRIKLADSKGVSLRASKAAYIAPENVIEQEVANIVQKLLGIEKVSVKDIFFEIGATSMHLVRLQNKLNDTFEKTISIVDIFEYPTISSLASFIDKKDKNTTSNTTSINRADKRGQMRMKSRRRRKSRII